MAPVTGSDALARILRASAWAVLCLVSGASVAARQTPQLAAPTQNRPAHGTSLILGQVVDASGGGVPGVIVTLSGGLFQAGGYNTNLYASPMAGGPRRTLTNAQGRFVFDDLPAGSYSMDAAKTGYVTGAYGRFRPGGVAQSLDLREGERNGSVKIAVWKFAAISGTLIDDVGEPLVGVSVNALGRSYSIGRAQFSSQGSATTDDRGVFRIATLTPGDYVLCVINTQSTVPAALMDAYYQARSSGTSSDFMRELSNGGASLGFSSNGGVRVGDYVVQNSGPYSRASPVGPEPSEDGRFLSFQTTFYPGVSSLTQATVIALASGEERSNVQLSLKLVPAVPVSGTLVGPDGPVPNMAVRLAIAYAADLGAEEMFDAGTSVTDANGVFRFLAVPVGQYTIRAVKVPPTPPVIVRPGTAVPSAPPAPPPLPLGPTLWTSTPVSVGENGVTNLAIRLNTGFRISGHFVFDGTLPKPAPSVVQTLSVLIQPIDGHQAGFAVAFNSRVDPDGTFTTYEVPPGRYSIRMAAFADSWQALQGWTFESSVADGRDAAGKPFNLAGNVTDLVITMTDHPMEISGTVRDSDGKPDPTAAVIVFSADRNDWSNFGETPRRMRYLKPTRAGGYRVASLPPGDYYVAAVPDSQAGDWQDPRFLQTLSRSAALVTVAKGEKKTQDVVTKSAR